MKMWSPIVSFFALLLCLYSVYFVYKIDDETHRQFAEQRLRYAVDYATEAGFRAALESDDIGLDYVDLTDVKVTPTNALITFESLMCLNYDMPIDDDNLAYIESYIPVALLVAGDGYYVAKTTETDAHLGDGVSGGLYGLRWGMKIPFSVEYSAGHYVAYSLNGVGLYEVYSDGTDGVFCRTLYDEGKLPKYTSLWSDTIIADRLNKEVNLAIRKRNEHFTANDANVQLFHVPSDFSTVSNNPIKSPSFVVAIQNAEFAGYKKLEAVSIGGTKVVEKQMVVGFTLPFSNIAPYSLQAGKYYCWSNDLPDEYTAYVTEYFNTIDEAALAGYYPAVALLEN